LNAKVSRIGIFSADIPFKKSFKHASRERNVSESIFARIEMGGGTVGFGESLPRPYVTGETQKSVLAALKKILPDSILGKTFRSFKEVVDFCSSFNTLSGAAKCACELALLDAGGKLFDCSVDEALGGTKAKHLRYSTAIGSESIFNTKISALKSRLYGIKDVKLKVGDGSDIDRLKAARQFLGMKADIRLDANCAWSADEAIAKLTTMRDFKFSAVEQPVNKGDIGSLKKVSDAIPEPVMADEALCSMEDAKKLAGQKACDMFNIRISKCGGLLNSMKIAEFAKQVGMSYQLGCQVGESGVLSAAGRHFASCINGVKYLEGSYAKFLLTEDIITEDISFGYGGFARSLDGAGLGITVDEKALNKYIKERVEIR
jgi:muconate cycloisomerase